METEALNNQIRAIINTWCERKDLGALAGGLLPAWLYNNRLTDGWGELSKALRGASNDVSLPDSERDTLERLWIEVDVMLRNR